MRSLTLRRLPVIGGRRPLAASFVPCVGIAEDQRRGRPYIGTGVAHVALCTVDRFAGDCDLVLLAVPAGAGAAVVADLTDAAAVAA